VGIETEQYPCRMDWNEHNEMKNKQ